MSKADLQGKLLTAQRAWSNTRQTTLQRTACIAHKLTALLSPDAVQVAMMVTHEATISLCIIYGVAWVHSSSGMAMYVGAHGSITECHMVVDIYKR